jgi:hypothetical protein
MAITPDAARGLTPGDVAEVERFEKKIDQYLAANQGKTSGSFPTFDFEWQKVPSDKVIQELIRRYEAAGWESVKHITGRDANGLQFMDKIPETLRRRVT